MASIGVESKTSNSVTLYLYGLDTEWSGGTRTVEWYITESGNIPTEHSYTFHKTGESLSNRVPAGGTVTFTGLKADNNYGIYCAIYHGSTLLATSIGYVKTESSGGGGGGGSNLPPSVTSYSAVQISPGNPEILVTLVGTNLVGYTLTLGLSYKDGTAFERWDNIPITSDNFTTTIVAASYETSNLSIVFDPGGVYKKAWTLVFRMVGESEEKEYFKWSSSVAQGLPVKNVSHTEWDAFINKIIEVLNSYGLQNSPITTEKYGYPIGTTYLQMLQDCYMEYDTDLAGYPLTARQFNVARFVIGSHVSTGINDKTSNSSKVIASELIKLATCLQTWQG